MVLQQTHFSMLLTDWLSLIIYIRKMSEMLKRGQYEDASNETTENFERNQWLFWRM